MRTASAAAVGGGNGDMCVAGLDFQKLDDVIEGSIVNCLPSICVGDDHAVAGSGEQNHAERRFAAGTLFDFDEVTTGRDANFMLWSSVRVAVMSPDDRYSYGPFTQHPPWLAVHVAFRIGQSSHRLDTVESGFA